MGQEFDFASLKASEVKKEADPFAHKVNAKELDYINKIVDKTGLSNKELNDLVDKKKTELKGLISLEGALFLIANDMGVDLSKEVKVQAIKSDPFATVPTKTSVPVEKPKEAKPKTVDATNPFNMTTKPKQEAKKVPIIVERPKPAEEQKHEIIIVENTNILEREREREQPLTIAERKVKIQETMELLKFMVDTAITEDDWWLPPQSKKKSLTRSGYNKIATIFHITTETIKIWTEKKINFKGEEDIVAYATVKATRVDGSSVTVTALKALSDYKSKKDPTKDPKEWVSMQFLEGTAETRALNRAIQNAFGFIPKDFSGVSKEELE